ncbi:MAG: hypothetical protein ABIT01_00225, partial [Thermoanaerobaculia bacterium]
REPTRKLDPKTETLKGARLKMPLIGEPGKEEVERDRMATNARGCQAPSVLQVRDVALDVFSRATSNGRTRPSEANEAPQIKFIGP